MLRILRRAPPPSAGACETHGSEGVTGGDVAPFAEPVRMIKQLERETAPSKKASACPLIVRNGWGGAGHHQSEQTVRASHAQ
eukprot:5954786-Pleurochrysis_carterae.AAC.2